MLYIEHKGVTIEVIYEAFNEDMGHNRCFVYAQLCVCSKVLFTKGHIPLILAVSYLWVVYNTLN